MPALLRFLRRPASPPWTIVLAVAVVSLTSAPAALADTATSGNWAGYSAHRSGVHFRMVSARWRVPTGACTAGGPSYSSVWVGLGGFSASSNALEQTGTELDCTRAGRAVYSAWYELVPAPARDISLGVHPGDLMQAAVSVTGHRVSITLQDLSDHRTFRQTFYAAQVDTTSADWIVEAPSACDNSISCFALPLADFGTTTLSSARAVTQSRHAGGVTSRWWGITTITLTPHSTRFFAGTADGSGGLAVPSPLSAGGSAFSVTYHSSSGPSGQTGPTGPYFSAPAARPLSEHLVHPLR